MRATCGAVATLVSVMVGVTACGTDSSSTSAPAAATSSSASVVVERDLDQPAPSSTATTTSAAPVEQGLTFGGYKDVLGGMSLAEVRSLGWAVEVRGGGDGCESYTARKGTDAINITGKNGTDLVSTVSVSAADGNVGATTARIAGGTVTFAQISAAYQDASITYTPPINRGPNGSVGSLIVASDDHPDRAILFRAYPAPDAPTPPADTVFESAAAGTASALTGGSFGCA